MKKLLLIFTLPLLFIACTKTEYIKDESVVTTFIIEYDKQALTLSKKDGANDFKVYTGYVMVVTGSIEKTIENVDLRNDFNLTRTGDIHIEIYHPDFNKEELVTDAYFSVNEVISISCDNNCKLQANLVQGGIYIYAMPDVIKYVNDNNSILTISINGSACSLDTYYFCGAANFDVNVKLDEKEFGEIIPIALGHIEKRKLSLDAISGGFDFEDFDESDGTLVSYIYSNDGLVRGNIIQSNAHILMNGAYNNNLHDFIFRVLLNVDRPYPDPSYVYPKKYYSYFLDKYNNKVISSRTNTPYSWIINYTQMGKEYVSYGENFPGRGGPYTIDWTIGDEYTFVVEFSYSVENFDAPVRGPVIFTKKFIVE